MVFEYKKRMKKGLRDESTVTKSMGLKSDGRERPGWAGPELLMLSLSRAESRAAKHSNIAIVIAYSCHTTEMAAKNRFCGELV